MEDWREFELSELLEYEQPSAYIVKSTNYDDSYSTPVLTAGKSFILGYTNETNGICTKHPLIVFDDFTTSTQYVDFSFKVKSSALKILHPNLQLVLPKFIYYRLQIINFDHSTHKRYWIQHYSKQKIKIPTLAEQERIVSRIEELFSELDNTTETLQRNKTLFKQYKLAVLSSAFKECSEKQSISQFASLVTSGSRGWAQYYSEQGVRFIRITDLSRDGIKLDDAKIQRVQLPHNVEGTRSKLNPHDILVSITADLGSIALVPEDIEESYINQHIALIRLKKPNQAKLIAWYLKSIEGRNALLKNKRGGGKLGLGLDDIRNTPVPCLSDHETKKIIAAIEAQLAVCEYQEAISEKVLRQISALKQSILKKAFEGKLA